ncbi:hypothetical protein DNTS_012960 [Danionella cerebrum]|uniref:Uncharacterized protein n=1 Tax=Danionella cerebrum TaxID=2873325 RepID=A0A553QDG5_9TELE|nr:hypothetical protein DNTS_012960 [Danionella translucida]
MSPLLSLSLTAAEAPPSPASRTSEQIITRYHHRLQAELTTITPYPSKTASHKQPRSSALFHHPTISTWTDESFDTPDRSPPSRFSLSHRSGGVGGWWTGSRKWCTCYSTLSCRRDSLEIFTL